MSIQTDIGNQTTALHGEVVAPPAPSLARSLGQAVAAVVLQCAAWKAEADLMALSDRTLKDIGLPRGEIMSAVREALGTGELGLQSSR